MNNFILVIDPAAELRITPTRGIDWREIADRAGTVLWNREGRVRRISNEVLRNALRLYGDQMAFLASGIDIVSRPVAIQWEQADVVDTRTGIAPSSSLGKNDPPPNR